MRLIKPPQGLHRDVECTAGERAQIMALPDQLTQFGRRVSQSAGPVEARDFAVAPIETEDFFETRDLAAQFQDRFARECGVGVPQRQLRYRSKNIAMPAEELTFWCRR